MKHEKELEIARSEFIKAFNSVVGIIRMNRLSRKVTVSLALMALIGGRVRIRNTAITFRLNYYIGGGAHPRRRSPSWVLLG